MSASRTFTVEHVIAATPWDVFELIADPDMQYQWRDPHSDPDALVTESEPYTRVVYSNGQIFELEPEGSGTRLHLTRTHEAHGFFQEVGIRFVSKKTRRNDMEKLLKRIDSALTYGDI